MAAYNSHLPALYLQHTVVESSPGVFSKHPILFECNRFLQFREIQDFCYFPGGEHFRFQPILNSSFNQHHYNYQPYQGNSFYRPPQGNSFYQLHQGYNFYQPPQENRFYRPPQESSFYQPFQNNGFYRPQQNNVYRSYRKNSFHQTTVEDTNCPTEGNRPKQPSYSQIVKKGLDDPLLETRETVNKTECNDDQKEESKTGQCATNGSDNRNDDQTNPQEENTSEETDPVSDPLPTKEPSDHGAGGKHKKKQHTEKWSQKLAKQNYTHQWMMTSLKGHTGQVHDMDFSSNGKFLATCAEDRVVFIWSTKDYASKDHKFLRYNIDFDHATHVSWSPDSKAFIINKASDNTLEVYKVARKADGWVSSITKSITFPKQFDEETVGIGIAINGKFIMSCSYGNQLVIWDLKGFVLATVETYLMNTFRARISPCGRFVAASGFAPDVKVWEVQFTKSGEFKQVVRAFELKGHTSGVYDFGFSADSSRMATVSKDGTWKVFDTKIEFEKGEDPHLLKTGNYKNLSNSAHLAVSPNGEVLAIATGSSLSMFSTLTGDCDKTITKIYSGNITKVLFDSAGDFVLTSGEKHVRVFHNVTGRRTMIATAKQKLKSSGNSAATKERLETMIKQAEDFLVEIGEPTRAEG